MTLDEVGEIAEDIFNQVMTKPSMSDECLLTGAIQGAYYYVKKLDMAESFKFKCFIERLRECASGKYMYNIIEAFTIPSNKLALHINKADIIVSTIIEHRMRNEL